MYIGIIGAKLRSPGTTESEIDYVLKAVTERVSFLRELSPLWELVQEGTDLSTIQWEQH
jgi:cysteine desulfurase